MKNNRQWLLRAIILGFTISVSITALPYGMIHIYSLFGEITSSVVIDDSDSEIFDESRKIENRKRAVGINIYNIWFEIRICVICMIFVEHMRRFPGGDTLVTLTVRMNN